MVLLEQAGAPHSPYEPRRRCLAASKPELEPNQDLN